jgi:isopentenyl phosphate kinase
MAQTCFLKLGGSLITDKDQAQTALLPQIDAIAAQIAEFIHTHPETRLLIGHGSGSFGHVAASRYHTRDGVHTSAEWIGFSEVWLAARALNQIFLERAEKIGLPVISFPLSAGTVTHHGSPIDWNSAPIQAALEHHLLPIVYGDVAFDDQLGATIVSTEEQFAALVPSLKPQRILLAGLEDGVWSDFPTCTTLIPEITPASYPSLTARIFGSASTDVTGGMASKVKSMLSLIQQYPQLQVQIFSGKTDGAIYQALKGDPIGTLLRSDIQGG